MACRMIMVEGASETMRNEVANGIARITGFEKVEGVSDWDVLFNQARVEQSSMVINGGFIKDDCDIDGRRIPARIQIGWLVNDITDLVIVFPKDATDFRDIRNNMGYLSWRSALAFMNKESMGLKVWTFTEGEDIERFLMEVRNA